MAMDATKATAGCVSTAGFDGGLQPALLLPISNFNYSVHYMAFPGVGLGRPSSTSCRLPAIFKIHGVEHALCDRLVTDVALTSLVIVYLPTNFYLDRVLEI